MDQLRQYLNNDYGKADSAMEERLLDDSMSEEVDTLLRELWDREVAPLSNIDKESILSKIKSSAAENHTESSIKPVVVKRHIFSLKYAITAAAAVIVGVVLTTILYDQPQEQPQIATVIQSPQPQVEQTPAEPVVVKRRKPSLEKIEAHEVAINVPEGETLALDFKCGSKAIIEGGSNMVYDENFVGETRHISLDGRAHFAVAKGDKPFIVNNSNVNVQVLGTEFYIDNRTNQDVIIVRVDKGHVMITTNKGTKIELHQGDDVVILSRKPDEN